MQRTIRRMVRVCGWKPQPLQARRYDDASERLLFCKLALLPLMIMPAACA